MKLTFNEFLNLNGWGTHTHIWTGSGAYIKTVSDWYYYEENRLKLSLPQNAPRSVFMAIDYECHPVLRKKIKKQTKENLKIVRQQLINLGEL